MLFLGEEKLYKTVFEEKETVTVGTGRKDTIYLEEMGQAELKCHIRRGMLTLTGKKIPDLIKESLPESFEGTIISEEKGLAVAWGEFQGTSDQTLPLPYRGRISAGRASDNTIIIKDPLISAHHLMMRVEEGVIHLEDGFQGRPSTNGTYVNGTKVRKTIVKAGDCVDLMQIRLRLNNGAIAIENAGKALTITSPKEEVSTNANVMNRKEKFRRSPRIREELPDEPIVLAKPTAKGNGFQKKSGLFSSLLGSGAMIGATVVMGAASPALLAARAASLVSPVYQAISGARSNRRGVKSAKDEETLLREKYSAYIEGQKAIISQVAEKQKEILNREFPAPVTNYTIVQDMSRLLWERRPSDSDFLDVRIGMGYDDLCVEVQIPKEQQGFATEQQEEEHLLSQIVEETRIVDHVPARLHLRAYQRVGVVGERSHVISLIQNLVMSLTTQHFYQDVRLVGFFDEEEREIWEPLRWLPHFWDAEGQLRYLAFDREDAADLGELFLDIIKSRTGEEEDRTCTPHYLFLFGSQRLTESLPMFRMLLAAGPETGVSSIFFYRKGEMPSEQQLGYLPPECDFIIDTDDAFGACAFPVQAKNRKFIFTLDQIPGEGMIDRFCRAMASIEVDQAAMAKPLPNGVTFLQGMGANRLSDLHVEENWNTNHADRSLCVPIGKMSGDKNIELDLVAHGPHGLIAGTTGSGKSEMITAWLLSIAIHYHPYDVSFVIIDYKGGGLADSLEGIPHMVGKITNIGENINRSMVSLHSELMRRQRIFADAGVNNIKDYMKGFHQGKFSEPLPRLLIVSDEFAELKAQEPDFMKSLISAARIGRSLGVHLVLATQNPSGIVDDQIRSNANFAICLKVKDPAASRDMIARPDAAHISLPGRGYLRVGTDEVFEQFQSFWSGAPYLGDKNAAAQTGNQVRIVQMNGTRLKTVVEEKTRFHAERTELEAISAHLGNIAEKCGLKKMPCPWLAPLPEELSLSEVLAGKAFDGHAWPQETSWLSVPLGMYDHPQSQSQGIYAYDFEAEGHLAIYGCAGSGTTTLLKTLIMSICRTFSPKDAQIYLMDFGTWSLSRMEELPHDGGVALSSQKEKFGKLADMIRRMFEERKMAFSSAGISSLSAYRKSVSADLPAIFIGIDNIVPIFEAYPDYEDLLTMIAREGASFGIYLIYTAANTTGIRYKITQNIRGAIALELTDSSDYSNLIGKVEDPKQAVGKKGRGFVRRGTELVLFQAAQFAEGSEEPLRMQEVSRLASQMNEAYTGPRPVRIPVMPDVVRLRDVIGAYEDAMCPPVGYSMTEIMPAHLCLKEDAGAIVSGSVGSGKSAFLRAMASLLTEGNPGGSVFVLDSERRGLAALKEKVSGYCTCDEKEEAETMLSEIIRLMIPRQEAAKAGEEVQDPLIALLLDDLPEFTENASDHAYKLLKNIIRYAKGLHVIVIAAGRIADLQKKADLDPVTSGLLKGGSGVLLGGTPALHTYFSNSLSYAEKNAEIVKGYAYLSSSGTMEKIKLLEE